MKNKEQRIYIREALRLVELTKKDKYFDDGRFDAIIRVLKLSDEIVRDLIIDSNGVPTKPKINKGIRILIHLVDVIEKPFFIEPITHIPTKGDLIAIENIIDEKDFTDSELNKIYEYSWSVWYVNFTKDKKGYLVELNCVGE